jgi:hypothetical protein
MQKYEMLNGRDKNVDWREALSTAVMRKRVRCGLYSAYPDRFSGRVLYERK